MNSTGDGKMSDIGKAIDWCRSQGVNIITMSLSDSGNHPGASPCPGFIDDKINLADDAYITIMAASGNNGCNGEGCINGISYPACSQNVISIGGTQNWPWGIWESIADYTNRAPGLLDLLAPGTDIDSADLGSGFVPKSGTSMATPHVAGVAALMLEANNNLKNNPSLVRTILRTTGVTIEGYPRVDALAAVEYVTTLENSQVLTISNIGNKELVVEGINDDVEWIESYNETSFTIQAGASRQISITANTNGMAPGTHNGNIIIYSDDPDEGEFYIPIKLIYKQPELSSDVMEFDFTVAGTKTNYVRIPKNATILGATASIREVY